MDGVQELTVAATALLTTGAVGATVGPVAQTVWDRLADLKNAVRARFSGDRSVMDVLASMESSAPPTDDEVQVLADGIERVAREDPQFLELLRSSVEAVRDAAGPSFATLVQGDAHVGKIVNIGRANDLSF